jgi:hypothetical protein
MFAPMIGINEAKTTQFAIMKSLQVCYPQIQTRNGKP